MYAHLFTYTKLIVISVVTGVIIVITMLSITPPEKKTVRRIGFRCTKSGAG